MVGRLTKVAKVFKLNHAALVQGKSCIHVNGDRSVCAQPVAPDMPNGWLCFYHQGLVNKVKLIPKEG